MIWAYLSTLALLFVGLLLIVVILLQRGRGGGLAGAFGGMGGQSAFGTKAGDVFTRITVVLATIWIALAGVSIWALEAATQGKYRHEVPKAGTPSASESQPESTSTGMTPASSEQTSEPETVGTAQQTTGSDTESTAAKTTPPQAGGSKAGEQAGSPKATADHAATQPAQPSGQEADKSQTQPEQK